ncbi:PorP/SprF family type IX secretion system membrane protein [Saprospira grandis]|uniref:Bacteroidetes-specific membrane protein n=1 Tax=Saprospira grandis (strain Lewin) TaxID=984262 RepID=H6LAH7_SAPGL|nr:PorP/SprF family type IX secretion system membrane protein [Saprospira grandis]AFC25570.1 bacteroidetes-specific membrane protein [Saprospira grandis str. Lewin]
MKLIRPISALLLLAFFCNLQEAKAQDPRYSQYYSAPARLSPALAGVMESQYRLGINYRSQWSSVLDKPYNTASFTAEGKFAVGKEDFVGVGFNAMRDVAGASSYSITDIGLDVNYQKLLTQGRGRLGKERSSYLIAGGHLGLGQRAIDWDQNTYSTQYDNEYGNGYYNPNINSGENMLAVRDSRIYADLHVGLMWYGTFGKRQSAYGGISIFHLNQPDISLFDRSPVDTSGNTFAGPTEKLYSRFNIHAGGEVRLGGRRSAMSLLPGAVVMIQGPSTEISTGVSLRYQAPKYDDFAFRFGLWNRLANQYVTDNSSSLGVDAIIFIVGLDVNQFQFGFSYDATMSTLATVNNSRGGMEVSLIYNFGDNGRRRTGCPTF